MMQTATVFRVKKPKIQCPDKKNLKKNGFFSKKNLKMGNYGLK